MFYSFVLISTNHILEAIYITLKFLEKTLFINYFRNILSKNLCYKKLDFIFVRFYIFVLFSTNH